MFPKLKKGVKRAIIFVLVLGAIFVIVLTVTNLAGDKIFNKSQTEVLLDMDNMHPGELFALTRALIEDDLKVVGITSVHSEFSKHEVDTTVLQSFHYNKKILMHLEKTGIPNLMGASSMLRYEEQPVPIQSPAADFIIRMANETGKNEKLNIIALGALTNIASAIMIKPEIAEKIRLYMLAMKYNPKNRIWNKNEPNSRNDLNALDFILNNENLELTIMPVSTAEKLVIEKTETQKYFTGKKGVWDFLLNEWDLRYPDSNQLKMEDLALIEAILDNTLVKSEETLPPPENRQRSVKAYTYINRELMKADFFSAVLKFQRKTKSEE